MCKSILSFVHKNLYLVLSSTPHKYPQIQKLRNKILIWNFQKVKKHLGRIQTIAELLTQCLQGVFGIIIWLDFSNFCAIFFNSFIFMHAKTHSCRTKWGVSDPSSFQLWVQLPCRSRKSVQSAHQRWLMRNGLSVFTLIYVHYLSTVSWNTKCWVLIKRVTISGHYQLL